MSSNCDLSFSYPALPLMVIPVPLKMSTWSLQSTPDARRRQPGGVRRVLMRIA